MPAKCYRLPCRRLMRRVYRRPRGPRPHRTIIYVLRTACHRSGLTCGFRPSTALPRIGPIVCRAYCKHGRQHQQQQRQQPEPKMRSSHCAADANNRRGFLGRVMGLVLMPVGRWQCRTRTDRTALLAAPPPPASDTADERSTCREACARIALFLVLLSVCFRSLLSSR